MSIVLIVLILVLCVGGWPGWGLHSYGFAPVSLGAVLVLVLIVLLLTGHI